MSLNTKKTDEETIQSAPEPSVLPKPDLPIEDSPEFDTLARERLAMVCAKYAWIAQQDGYVLRKTPLKLAPYDNGVFYKICKAQYGFLYKDAKGRLKSWKPQPDLDPAFGMYYEPEYFDEDCTPPPFIIAERLEFLPGKPELTQDADDCRVLNLWRPPPWRLDKRLPEPKPFLEHISYLFDADQQAIEHVLDFLAHLVQRPDERIAHALLLTSEAKGIGKSSFGTIVRRLVGDQNSRVAQTKDLKGQFDGWIMGKLVVQVDEVYEAGNWDLANKLKPLITEPRVSVNVKYGPQMEIENYARLILFSNHTAPLTIEEGDRRYFVFNSNAQPRDDSYYDTLHQFIDSPEGMNAIYSFLRKRDLSAFNAYRRPPMTRAKQEMIESSVHPLRTYIAESVASGYFVTSFAGLEFTWDALERQLHKDGYGAHAKNAKELGQALALASVTHVRTTVNGRKVRKYRLPGNEGDQADKF
jgi:hypothetical protein